MKVLIVDPDAQRVPPLQQALTAAGAEVALAPSGSFALTMLEWNRQDVIVSRPVIGDMDALELCSIVRADPATREVRFVLVAGAGEIETDRTAAAGVDLVLPTDMTAAMILTLVSLMRRERERQKAPAAAVAMEPPVPSPPPNGVPRLVTPAAEPVRTNGAAPPAAQSPAPAAAEGPPPAAPSSVALAEGLARVEARTLQGSLGIMRLEEITQALAAGGKTGRLIVAVGGSGGLVAFDHGAPVHAEYRDGTGETALAAMIVTARRERAGRFCFIPGEPVANAAPRTIDRTLSQVLVDLAPAGDDGEAAASRQPGER